VTSTTNLYGFFILSMNYKKVYDNIIENRLSNPLSETEYGEKHHIIPRSLGGSNGKDNLVRLSAREHFICHALLAEMYEYESVEWIKMNRAFMMMKGSRVYQNRYFNSRLYELKRKDFSKVQSLSQSGSGNSQYGKPKSEEVRNKISKSLIKDEDGLPWRKARSKRRKEINMQFIYNGIYIRKQVRNNIFRLFGIDSNKDIDSVISELRSFLHRLYVDELLSTVELGNRFGCSDVTILNYLKLVDIPRRTLSDSVKIAKKTI